MSNLFKKKKTPYSTSLQFQTSRFSSLCLSLSLSSNPNSLSSLPCSSHHPFLPLSLPPPYLSLSTSPNHLLSWAVDEEVKGNGCHHVDKEPPFEVVDCNPKRLAYHLRRQNTQSKPYALSHFYNCTVEGESILNQKFFSQMTL